MKIRYEFRFFEGKFIHRLEGKAMKSADIYGWLERPSKYICKSYYCIYYYRSNRKIKQSRYIFGKLTEEKLKCAKDLLARKLDKIMEEELERKNKLEKKEQFINKFMEPLYD